MVLRVGVAGVGWSSFAPTTLGTSYKELMFEAARLAYADADLDPRSEIDSFVCCSEDLEEGTSIFDEYVPDQLGAVQRPVQADPHLWNSISRRAEFISRVPRNSPCEPRVSRTAAPDRMR